MEKLEPLICGVAESKIRKAYFSGKLYKLLADMQAGSNWGMDEWNRLKDYFETLKQQDTATNEYLANFLPKIETEQPDSVLDELNKEKLSDAEIAELEKEKANREAAVNFASKMIKGLFVKFYSPKEKTPTEDELMDMGFEILGLQYYLIRDALYKERLFRRRIVEFERAGKQRKTAEEYAKTETTYREYMLAEGLKELAQEFINMVKKRYKNM